MCPVPLQVIQGMFEYMDSTKEALDKTEIEKNELEDLWKQEKDKLRATQRVSVITVIFRLLLLVASGVCKQVDWFTTISLLIDKVISWVGAALVRECFNPLSTDHTHLHNPTIHGAIMN